ncbi:MAG: glycosyltransferase family 4 protein [Acidobacteria bacterium]|nr:glycosyltransferase family 4 protein [Acidobacteriota bacterium]
MQICLVSQEYPPETGGGGIGTQVHLKAHALAKRGHAVHVISSDYDGPGRTYMDRQVVVHRIPHPAGESLFSEPSVHWVIYSERVARKLYKLFEQVRFDLIEFPEYAAEGFIYQMDAYRYHRLPIVVMLHGSLAMFAERTGWPELDSDFYRFGSFMEDSVVQRADLLLAGSRNIASFWAKRCGLPIERIPVTHIAVDAVAFPLSSARVVDRPTILFVGRVDEVKGVFSVTDAVLRLKCKYPSILLRIIGTGNEEDMTKLRETIEAGQAQSQIEFLGYIDHDQLATHYARCDVFASPAPSEHGVATVYLEAMSCGKPVVACSTGGAPEGVIHGQTGLLVPPGDVDALARAFDRLLSDTELLDRLGKNGREMVEKYFCVEKYIERVEKLYLQLLTDFNRYGGRA